MSCLLALLLACAGAEPGARNPDPAAGATTVVYPARRIHTMDPSRPEASAVAVRDGRIVGVGEVSELARDGAARIDPRFSDRVLLPGFVENHLHPMMAAVLLPMEFVTPYDWDLPGRRVEGVRGRAAFIARVRELEGAHPVAAPLFVWGYHASFHGALSRDDLNAITEERPLIVWHRSFHELYANDAALAWMELDAEDVAGHPQIDFADGHFYETGLSVAMAKLAPTILAPDWIARGLALTERAIHLGGITTVADMAFGLFDLESELAAIRRLDRDDVPFRTVLVANAAQLTQALGPERAFATIAALPEHQSARLRFPRQVKLFSDGAFYSQLMQMSEGYTDGHHGEWLMEPDVLLATARVWWNAGYQIHVHANGDLGVASALDALETLLAESPRADHRFTLHHVGYSTEAQSLRMAKLHAMVSANPYYVYALGDVYGEQGLGPERAAHMVRLGSLVRAGVPVSLHSDFTMAPVEPLRLAAVAVNRRSAAGHVLAPEERLTVAQALRAVTLDAARAIRFEDEIGSIEVGKRADFTVLERDPFEVPPEQLADIPIWGTVFEGEPFPLEGERSRLQQPSRLPQP